MTFIFDAKIQILSSTKCLKSNNFHAKNLPEINIKSLFLAPNIRKITIFVPKIQLKACTLKKSIFLAQKFKYLKSNIFDAKNKFFSFLAPKFKILLVSKENSIKGLLL